MCVSVYLLVCTYIMFMQFPRRSEEASDILELES